MAKFKTIGRSTPLRDGAQKVTGTQRFLPDLYIPGMLHARLVTSPHAHARILSIESDAALDVSGVFAVLTADDLPYVAPERRNRLMLARSRVIFAGQPVALVLADSAAAAEDGAERVWVDYEALPAAVTISAALAPDAPLVWPGGTPGDSGEAAAHGADLAGDDGAEAASNVAARRTMKRGDSAAGFAEADVVSERTWTTPSVHQSYLETMGIVMQPDPFTGGMTVWTSTQAPFYVREQVAQILGVDESDVRVVPTLPGGAFGAKFMLYEPLIALVVQKLNRPVRFVLSRSEDMVAAHPAPAAQIHIKLGARNDGTLVALEADLVFDTGCYPSPHGIAALLLGSYYKIPNVTLNYSEVLTFKLSVAAYRAPGAPQGTLAIETAVDDVANQLQMDAVALRLKNAAAPGDEMIDGRPWPQMGMRQVLEAAQALPIWQSRATARAKGRGVGFAIGGWPGGIEPTAASCQLHRDGTLHVHIGSVDLTGTPTGMALIAAEAFGISPEKVRVITGDTATALFAGSTGGSKITYMLGPSVIQAAEAAREQVLAVAADEFEADSADLEIVDDAVRVRGVPDKQVSLGEIARKTMRFGGKYPPITATGRHAETTGAPAFCVQIAEVSVDRETGEVTVEKLAVVQDVGRALNPLTVRGQMDGGATQGLGWALYEQMVHDESGQLLTGSWLDYTVPHFAHKAITLETTIVEVPSESGPFGARGVGEPPIIPTAAAVANAIKSATGVWVTDLPMTPPRILAALGE